MCSTLLRRVLIDPVAKDIARKRFGLRDCLHVPIAARSVGAIEAHVGSIVQALGGGTPATSYLVEAFPAPAIDHRLPIWANPASGIFHRRLQVWADVRYTRYRTAYRKAFPSEDISGKVLSRALNRRVAAIKGFQYVRITPTSSAANSSSAFTEQWSVDHHSDPKRMALQKRLGAEIQYADLTDLLLMMDVRLGGGLQDIANDGQALVKPPLPESS